MSDSSDGLGESKRLPSQLPSLMTDATHLYSPQMLDRKASDAWPRTPSRPVSSLWSTPGESVRSTSSPFTPEKTGTPADQQGLPVSLGILSMSTYCTLHLVLGATIWLLGLVNDSLGLVGLGFMFVFDALGLLSTTWMRVLDAKAQRETIQHQMTVLAEDTAASPTTAEIAQPFGLRRLETLLDFSLVVYLLFAAIYMCKENLEHALLAAGQPHEEDRQGIHLPVFILLAAMVMTIFTNGLLRCHARLATACGMGLDPRLGLDGLSTRKSRNHARNTSVLSAPLVAAGPLYDAVSNPFGMMTLFFTPVLCFCALFLPATQVASLDKILAGLQGAAMLYISISALGPLCKVLLQASPSQKLPQMLHLHRALDTIEQHALVSQVKDAKVWQLTLPSLAYTKAAGGTEGQSGLAGIMAMKQGSKTPSLVATVHVLLKPEATAEQCAEMVRYVMSVNMDMDMVMVTITAMVITAMVPVMSTAMVTITVTVMVTIMSTAMVTIIITAMVPVMSIAMDIETTTTTPFSSSQRQ
ncbi:hypothetical protein MVES1_002505 [Malassezia vespertilionis]|uniref:uncharacterized protein n=1 Tax=Malassezia vespertilionis TaxID=2020962 RepID=UPI0024B0F495|nr:uncharacterized protein MVES1_002505 [Malassezia vespertilionis]WFD07147.1 hypothetical protein MVES1_002505 [Malassezia vespertilionis]